MVVSNRVVLGEHKLLIKLTVTVVVIVAALVRWDAGAALFMALLVASVTGLLDRRVSIVLGLLSLAACPLLLIADHEAWLQRSPLVNYYAANVGLYNTKIAADTVAIWAYYFLCIGVAAQIVRYIVETRHESEKTTV